ncbi:hypothetical protein [Frankia gtarii]|uniref:hypothetical protein n=1 Tax=Frankia gtarii TaxID=2950102 RepID=UPI0021C06643|nr:hypothetical protein [Frankia gtarii]
MLARVGEQPDWFAPATEAVLQEADVLLAAAGPRELEEATVRLLGRQLRRAVRESSGGRGSPGGWPSSPTRRRTAPAAS